MLTSSQTSTLIASAMAAIASERSYFEHNPITHASEDLRSGKANGLRIARALEAILIAYGAEDVRIADAFHDADLERVIERAEEAEQSTPMWSARLEKFL